jgi:hypothetical protein
MTAATSSTSPPIFRPSLWVEPPRHSTTVPVDSPTVSNVQHIEAILRPSVRARRAARSGPHGVPEVLRAAGTLGERTDQGGPA